MYFAQNMHNTLVTQDTVRYVGTYYSLVPRPSAALSPNIMWECHFGSRRPGPTCHVSVANVHTTDNRVARPFYKRRSTPRGLLGQANLLTIV